MKMYICCVCDANKKQFSFLAFLFYFFFGAAVSFEFSVYLWGNSKHIISHTHIIFSFLEKKTFFFQFSGFSEYKILLTLKYAFIYLGHEHERTDRFVLNTVRWFQMNIQSGKFYLTKLNIKTGK